MTSPTPPETDDLAARVPDTAGLAACPFCNAEPRGCEYVGDDDGGYWAIECVASRADHFAGVHGDSEAATIAEWNTRSLAPPPEAPELTGLCERLRELLAKATPGPWRVSAQGHSQSEPDPESGKDSHNAIWSDRSAQGPYPVICLSSVRPKNEGDPWPWMLHLSSENAALIVAMKNALPTLLSEIALRRDTGSGRPLRAGLSSQATEPASAVSAVPASIPDASLEELRAAAAELARRAEVDTCADWPSGVDGSYLDRVRAAIDATYPVIWTDEQVAKLNEFQAGYGHPFTCGSGNRMDAMHNFMRGEEGEDDYGQLIATPQGWMCPACDYRQFWAHDFMFNGAMPNPFAQGIEARRAETGTGSVEDESAVGNADAPEDQIASGRGEGG